MRVLRSAFALLALVALVACSKTAASPSESSTPAESSAAPAAASQTLSLTYKSPTVGADVIAKATGLPAGKTVDLTWGTVTGGWVVEDYYRFRGKKYRGRNDLTRQIHRRQHGALDARFTIPEDYGGVHEVIALIDGKPVAQNGIEVTQSFELTPASGPVGTPLELRVKGTRLADDGEHVGGELGQQPRGIRLRCGNEGIGSRPIPSGRTRRAITWSGSSPDIRVRVI